MKQFLSLLLISCSFSALAQKSETWLDFNRKPCEPGQSSYYCTVEKTDSGWLRRDYYTSTKKLWYQGLFEDSAAKIQHGSHASLYANGRLAAYGRREHGKREGVFVQYYSNGMMMDSALFRKDKRVASKLVWHRNGYPSDSIYYANDSISVHILWFDDGAPAGSGYEMDNKPHGKWKYFHLNGTVSAELVYAKGRLLQQTYFNEDGTPQPDNNKANAPAQFKKGGAQGWNEYLGRGLSWPRGVKLVNTDRVTIGLEFTVTPDGEITDAEVVVPFNREFDQIALDVLHRSPKWIPALQHNRRVPQRVRQAVVFRQR